MRPRVFHRLSRSLALRLEKSLEAGDGDVRDSARLPVFLCHPTEVVEQDGAPSTHASGVLYLFRVEPARDLSRAAVEFVPAASPGGRHALRTAGLRVRLRFAFLVVGGTLDDELGALAQVLEHVHKRPWIEIDETDRAGDGPAGVDRDGGDGDGDIVPLSIVPQTDAWREIGLDEHRLMVVIDALVPLSGRDEADVEPILERDLDVRVDWPEERSR